MCRLILVMLFAGALVVLAGCSKYWYQQGKSFEECKNARSACYDELGKRTDFQNPTLNYEIEFIDDCMMKKGYRKVPANKLPLDAKREQGPGSYHWRLSGVAGSLEE